MHFTPKLSRIAAIVATAGVVLFGADAATASTRGTAPNGGNTAIADGSVWQSDIAKPVNDLYLRDLGKGSVVKTIATTTIANIGGKFADRKTQLGGFQLPAGTWLITSNAVFNRTVGATATDTKTRPQLALRYGPGFTRCAPEVHCSTNGEPFAGDAGTIMGVDISPTKGRELMGATVQTVTTTKPVVVMVYGFGYNDDGSDFASGQITVSAQITATKIG